jgi:CCR4-NOT transcriptional complex subunit CAF120
MPQIETLPTRSNDVQPLQNVLSISTAGKNRYLFHFNSLHSLTQWTAAIRLAMFEHTTLQEAYTGSLIAGKGKLLNNIKVIMDRTKIRNEDWTRVRFGAGTPWRRCWCVLSPPDEKDISKQQKLAKKKSAYERTAPLQGNIKFYDTKKTKKAQPIATINDAYSAYAIYPQSKPLIDQSTLVKIEGSITIHSTPETTTDGFVFVMPEVHPAVTGFEMMLRYLFPVYDVFALYGRPNRLVADTLDTRSLMFALPQEKRYGYLEILDVAGLIHETGSQSWSDREWRKKMKDLTAARMKKMTAEGRPRSRASSYRGYRNSLPNRGASLRYEDGASIKSTPSLLSHTEAPPMPPPHSDSAPPTENGPFPEPRRSPQHQRSFSAATPSSTNPRQQSQRYGPEQSYTPSRLSHEQSRPSYDGPNPAVPSYEQGLPQSGRPSYEQGRPPQMGQIPYEQASMLQNGRPPYEQSRMQYDQGPPPPAHGIPIGMAARNPQMQRYANEVDASSQRSSSDSERRFGGVVADPQEIQQELRPAPPPSQVAAPPAFSHEPGAKPQKRPGINAEMRRANSRLSITTLSQLADAGRAGTGGTAAAGAAAAWRSNSQRSINGSPPEDQGQRGVNTIASKAGVTADRSPTEALILAKTHRTSRKREGSLNSLPLSRDVSPDASPTNEAASTPYYKDRPLMSSYDLLPAPPNPSSRAVSPLSQSIVSSPPLGNGTARTFSGGNMDQAAPATPSISTHMPYQLAQAAANGSTFPNVGINKPLPVPMDSQRPQPQRSNTSHSIGRKPVPSHTPPPPVEIPGPVAKSSMDSLNERYIDEEALTQILARQHTQSLSSQSQHGIGNDDQSVYDNDSTVSPDYASTRRSTDTRRSRPSVDKPRRGVLRTVGTVDTKQEDVLVGDIHYRPGAAPEPLNPDIPSIDFGPIRGYDTEGSSRPTTGGTLMQSAHERTEDLPATQRTLGTMSRSNDRADTPPMAQHSPSKQPNASYERSPSRNMVTPEPQLRSSSAAGDSDNRRSIAWSPGTMIGGGSPGAKQSITPEQFVQQRATANRVMTPIYAHGRQGSESPTARVATPPTVSRNSSGEWPVQIQRRQSSYSTEMPVRPHSRAALAPIRNPSGDHTAHLSAREQENVARVTGSPLVNMAGKKDTSHQGGGLVAAIEAREREKKEAKKGMNGQMVQHAIAAQRQQQGQAQQRQQSFQLPTPQFAMPGQFPQTPNQQTFGPSSMQQQYYTQQQQQQQYYAQYGQYPQQQRQQWTPNQGMQQQSGASPSQQQGSPYQQQPQQYPQGAYQGQYGQAQQQYYGPYFGNGQGRQ